MLRGIEWILTADKSLKQMLKDLVRKFANEKAKKMELGSQNHGKYIIKLLLLVACKEALLTNQS